MDIESNGIYDLDKNTAKFIVEMSLGCACDNCLYGDTDCYKEKDCGGAIVRLAQDKLKETDKQIMY